MRDLPLRLCWIAASLLLLALYGLTGLVCRRRQDPPGTPVSFP